MATREEAILVISQAFSDYDISDFVVHVDHLSFTLEEVGAQDQSDVERALDGIEELCGVELINIELSTTIEEIVAALEEGLESSPLNDADSKEADPKSLKAIIEKLCQLIDELDWEIAIDENDAQMTFGKLSADEFDIQDLLNLVSGHYGTRPRGIAKKTTILQLANKIYRHLNS